MSSLEQERPRKKGSKKESMEQRTKPGIFKIHLYKYAHMQLGPKNRRARHTADQSRVPFGYEFYCGTTSQKCSMDMIAQPKNGQQSFQIHDLSERIGFDGVPRPCLKQRATPRSLGGVPRSPLRRRPHRGEAQNIIYAKKHHQGPWIAI